MKILLCSHAAWRRTGYGAPVLDLIKLWGRLGHETVILAVEERGPAITEYAGIRHYLPTPDSWSGADIVRGIVKREKPDRIVSLMDVWPLPPGGYSIYGVPWIAWFPVDQEPPQFNITTALGSARRALVFSKWGTDIMRRLFGGREIAHMPYGIDVDVMSPRRDERAFSFKGNAFVIGMVGTNRNGDRKNLTNALAGFALFLKMHPDVDAHLVMWTNPYGETQGSPELVSLREALGVVQRVHFPDSFDYHYGGRAIDMARVYNSFDVLLQPSAAEGWGIPIVEALACGVPVVATNCSSMTELVQKDCGVLINGHPEWSSLMGWWRRPTPHSIAVGIENAMSLLQLGRPDEIAQLCRSSVLQYSWYNLDSRWAEALKA